jgi:ribulose-5-phosphate 4-epimerase/fuculose-1-phosphate aldolase
MNVSSALKVPAVNTRNYDSNEWRIRCELAALYRVLAHYRMTDLIYTHISARLPGPEHHFLINAYGRMFHEMRASDLVKINVKGEALDASSNRINTAGFVIHSAIHMARPDLRYVIHTHTAAGIAISAQKHGLLPLSQHALKFYGHLAYHDYEGIALETAERDRLTRDLGMHRAMILRNHGLLVCGRTVSEAFDHIYFLERACQAQLAAMTGGAELILPPEEVRQHTAAQFNPGDVPAYYDLAWEAVLREMAFEKTDAFT